MGDRMRSAPTIRSLRMRCLSDVKVAPARKASSSVIWGTVSFVSEGKLRNKAGLQRCGRVSVVMCDRRSR